MLRLFADKIYNFHMMHTRESMHDARSSCIMQSITVNDQSRSYYVAKGQFTAEVSKGTATAFAAQLTPSTNVPESGTSTLLAKTTGGSGFRGGQLRVADSHNETETHPTYRYNISVNVSMSEGGDVTHLADMGLAMMTYLFTDGGAKAEQIMLGMHDA